MRHIVYFLFFLHLQRVGGEGPLSNAFAGTCSWDSLYTRSDEVLAACCETEQDCPGGIPNSCSIECGQVSIEYLPTS